MVAGLIAGRLIHARRRISKLLGISPSQMHRDITGASAILIESAVPLAILGLGSAIMKGVSSAFTAINARPEVSGRVMIADYVFATLYPAFVVRNSFCAMHGSRSLSLVG